MFFTNVLSSTGAFCALVTLTACGQGTPLSTGEIYGLGTAKPDTAITEFLQAQFSSITQELTPVSPPKPTTDVVYVQAPIVSTAPIISPFSKPRQTASDDESTSIAQTITASVSVLDDTNESVAPLALATIITEDTAEANLIRNSPPTTSQVEQISGEELAPLSTTENEQSITTPLEEESGSVPNTTFDIDDTEVIASVELERLIEQSNVGRASPPPPRVFETPSIHEVLVSNDQRSLTVTVNQGANPNVVFDYHLGSFPQPSNDRTRSYDLGDSQDVGGQLTYTFTDLPMGQYTAYGRVYFSVTNFSEGGDSLVSNNQYVDFTAQVDIAAPALVENYITIGNQPGDATCLALGQDNVQFGSAKLSNWGDWLGNDPRFFIGKEFLSTEDDAQFGKVLRHKFVPNHKGTEWVAMGANIKGNRTYRVVQSIFLEEGWDWGGERYQGGKLGFGFGSGTYPTGGKDDPKGFTARLGWRGNRDGTAKLIVYSYAADRSTAYGEDLFVGEDSMPVGRWIEIVMEVTANSSINISDGSLRAWVDGELKLEKYNIGWQLGGNQPSIDSLFYMGMYGGNGWDWSPDQNTYMKLGDICWAPVINGYSGIDPDGGKTKISPSQQKMLSPDDDLGHLFMDSLEKNKYKLIGSASELALQLDLSAQSSSYELTDALNQASSSINGFAEEISKSNSSAVAINPISKLQTAYEGVAAARHATSVQDDQVLHEQLSSYSESLKNITIETTSFSFEIAKERMASMECETAHSSTFCITTRTHIENAQHLQYIFNTDSDIGRDVFFNTAKQIWQATSEIAFE